MNNSVNMKIKIYIANFGEWISFLKRQWYDMFCHIHDESRSEKWWY